MTTDRWPRFPVVSLDERKQAVRDATELADTIQCTAQTYGISRDRMARALDVLAREWAAPPRRGREAQ